MTCCAEKVESATFESLTGQWQTLFERQPGATVFDSPVWAANGDPQHLHLTSIEQLIDWKRDSTEIAGHFDIQAEFVMMPKDQIVC